MECQQQTEDVYSEYFAPACKKNEKKLGLLATH